MRIPTRSPHWAEDRADYERSIGIPDRNPLIDTRPVHTFDFRADGGQHWQAEPRPGMVSYKLRDLETERVVYVGTLKQCLRWMSSRMVRRLGARNLQ